MVGKIPLSLLIILALCLLTFVLMFVVIGPLRIHFQNIQNNTDIIDKTKINNETGIIDSNLCTSNDINSTSNIDDSNNDIINNSDELNIDESVNKEDIIFDTKESEVCYYFNNKYKTNFEEKHISIIQMTNVNGDSILECLIDDQGSQLQYKVYYYQNSKYITDDYSKKFYGEIFDKDLKEILEANLEENELEYIDYNMFYSMNKKSYITANDFDGYIKDTDVHYVISFNVDNIKDYELKMLGIVNSLDELNYQYSISIISNNEKKKTIFRSKTNTSKYTLNDLKID